MIKFGVMTDIQYTDRDTIGSRYYRESLTDILIACGTFLQEQPEFVFHLGDLTNDRWNSLTAVLEILQVSKLPFRHVIGNHEFIEVPDEKKKEIMPLLGLPSCGYHSFVQTDDESGKTWRFIVLNGSEISVYCAASDAERKRAEEYRKRYKLPNGQLSADWNGAVSREQLQWLENELVTAEKQNENVLVLSHFPLFNQPAGTTEKEGFDTNTTEGEYPFLLGWSYWNGQEVLDVMDRHHCIKAYFSGHLHEGGFGIRKNVYHVTFEGIIEPGNAFAMVTLRDNHIEIQGYGRTKSRTLKPL